MSENPLVVGLVGNDIVNDSRVKKVAASAAKAGLRSTIVCYSPSGRHIESRMGDVDVIRIPVSFAVKNGPNRVPHPVRPVAATELVERHLGPRKSQLARRRRLESDLTIALGGSIGWTLVWLRLQKLRIGMWIRRQGFRIRRRGHVTWDRAIRRFNLSRTRASLKLFEKFRNPVANLLDYEITFGPKLEELGPDIIHAHDYHMIGVAVTAARMLKARGKDTKVVYDAHELIEGLSYPSEVIEGWLDEEATYIDSVDSVLGISQEQAERITERYNLPDTPTVVLNAPLRTEHGAVARTIRDDATATGNIVVYHGNIAEERGVFTLVDALLHLPDETHIAILAPAEHPLRDELESRASDLSVDDRLHILDFVPAEDLTGYLATADLAVVPYLLTGNNDIALPNKLFEALQAGLPVLTSDMRALSRVVTENNIGLVFKQGNPADLADKATQMLDNIAVFRALVTTEVKRIFGWDAQAEKLLSVYQTLVEWQPPTDLRIEVSDIVEPPPEVLWEAYRPTRLAIGPRNMAGQAHLIARAVETRLSVPAVSFSVEKPGFDFPVDQHITLDAWKDPDWQTHQRRLLSSTFTHVLAESGTGMLGTLNGGFIDEQLGLFEADRVQVGVLLHGSEIRDPRRHRGLPFSPYAEDDDLIRALEKSTSRLRRHLEGNNVPLYVTTPDLLEDINGTWLPVVIDPAPWAALDEAFQGDLPIVLHLPTNGLLKGSDHVDRTLSSLQDQGLIHYLRPTETLKSSEVRSVVATADIVIDGIVLGAYGVMSCQAMAAGRVAIANIRDLGSLRDHCPIVDADPSTLETVLTDMLSDLEGRKEIAEAGREYVATYHDGAYTAEQLRPFLGLD